MAAINNTSTLGVQIETQQNGKDGRENLNLAAETHIHLGSHVETTVFTSTSLQNSFEMDSSDKLGNTPAASQAAIPGVTTTPVAANESFPALAKTTKPIPSSVFSYRFASPTKNQTPYYISSDIVLSGGIAQQTRRRIVHNEVERRRKDKINGWIFRLANHIPDCRQGKQSKNLILGKACDYLAQVNKQIEQVEVLQKNNGQLAQEAMNLRSQVESALKQNEELRQLLKQHMVTLPMALKFPPVVSKPGTADSATQTDQCVELSLVNSHATVSNTTVTPLNSSAIVSVVTETASSVMPQVVESYSLKDTGSVILKTSAPTSSPPTVSVSRRVGIISAGSPVQQNANLTAVLRPTTVFPQQGSQNAFQGQQTQSVNIGQVPQNSANASALVQTSSQMQNTVNASALVQTSSQMQNTVNASALVQTSSQMQNTANASALVQTSSQMQNTVNGNPLVQLGFHTPQQQSTANVNTLMQVGCNTPLHHHQQQQRITNSTAMVHASFSAHQTLQQSALNANTTVHAGFHAPQQQRQQQSATNANALVQEGFHTPQVQQQSTTNPNSLVQPGFHTQPQPQQQTTMNANSLEQTCFQAPQAQQVGLASQSTASYSLHSVASIMNGNSQPALSGVLTVPSGLVSVPQTVMANSLGTSQARNAVTAVVVTPVAHIGSQGNASTVLIQQPVLQQQIPSFLYVNAAPQALAGFTVSAGPSTQIVNPKVSYPKSKTKSNKASKRKVSNPTPIQGSNGNKKTSQRTNSTGQKRRDRITSTKTPVEPSAKKTSINKQHMNADICHHEEILNIQNFSVSSLIPSIDAQSSAPTSVTLTLPAVSSTSMQTQTVQKNALSCLPYSIESLTGVSKESEHSQYQQQQHSIQQQQQQPIQQQQQRRPIQQQQHIQQQHQQQQHIQQRQRQPTLQRQPLQQQQQPVQQQQQQRQPIQQQQRQPIQQQQQQQNIQQAQHQAYQQLHQQQQMQYQPIQQRHERQKQQQQQQVQQQTTPVLSFSAESLLAPSDDILSNIHHINSSVSEATTTAQSNFSVSMASAFHESSSDSTTQSLANFSTEALIGGAELLDNDPSLLNGQDVSHSEKLTATPSTTAFSDFSAESLISSSDLNSGLSYAIDNLISRPDSSFNSSTMVSVNPNLLHSMRTDLAQEQATNPLHSLGAIPDLLEPKDTLTVGSHTSVRSVVGTVGQQACPRPGLFPFSRNQAASSRQLKDFPAQPPMVSLSAASNCVTSSAGFLKHSVDSITSSLYGPMAGGGTFSMATSPVSSTVVSPFHGNGFGTEAGSISQFSFSLGNSFSPPKSSYQGSVLGTGFV